MKLCLILAGFFLLSGPSKAQDPEPAIPQEVPATPRVQQAGNVAAAKLITRVQPIYPPLARQTHISGNVRLHAIIATDGTVKSLDVVSGHPLLQQAALDAIHQWRYEPTLLNDQAVEVDTTIDVIFALDRQTPPARPANIDSQLRADILQLFQVMHFKENASKGGRQMFESLRPALLSSIPDTPQRERITDAYIEKLLAIMQSDAYFERVITAYAKYFSDADVKGLIQFYQTPTGEHFNAVMPQLLGDLNEIGQSLALDNIPAIFKQLCKEFPELEDDPRFCKNPNPQRNSKLARPGSFFANAF